MNRNALLGLAFLMLSLAACLDTERLAPPEADDPENAEAHPFYVAVFDHTPTENEIQDDFARFLMSAHDKADPSSQVNPTGWSQPVPGQKLVRITATTADGSASGTDESAKVQFVGVWQAGSLQMFSMNFVLNNPNVDDLNRNSVNVFYYLLGVGGASMDRFVRGLVTSSSTDGWGCESIALHEYNYKFEERSQWLPFNDWIDYPSSPQSETLAASNTAWFSYY